MIVRWPVRVRPERPEDRLTPGTKAERDPKPPLGIRVRYGIAIVLSIAAAYVAGTAVQKAQTSHDTAQHAKATAAQAAAQAARTRQLTDQVAALTRRLATDEHATCTIQARGLPASHDLAAFVSSINGLLRLSNPARERANGATPAALRLLATMERSSGAYTRIEAKQPRMRTC